MRQLTDSCPACWRVHTRTLNEPRSVRPDGEGTRADYICSRCGCTWFTGWGTSFAEAVAP